jgi:hypothetical protein
MINQQRLPTAFEFLSLEPYDGVVISHAIHHEDEE